MASDEQKVESAIRDFYATLDSEGFRAAVEQSCALDRAEFAAMSTTDKEAFRSTSFDIDIDTVEDITITRDKATAEITGVFTVDFPGEGPETDTTSTEHLVKEDGRWKICYSEDKG